MLKQSGPMVCQSKYTRCLKNKFVGPLKEMYSESFQNGYLPPTLRGALITLILKPDNCESYRPISSLNTDAENLAARLGKCVPSLRVSHQNGFIKNGQATHNIM